jgi:hypothetical protein
MGAASRRLQQGEGVGLVMLCTLGQMQGVRDET